jgi:hypothetical protein
MGSSREGFDLLSPVGTFAQSDRPTFSWESLTGATSYEITIVDSQGNEVATHTLPSDGASKKEMGWTIPSALKRGGVYIWQVVATRIKDGKEERIKAPQPGSPDAKFKVLGQEEMNALNAKRKNAKSPLELAKIYIDYGLLSDAERELRVFRMGQKTTP